MWGTCSHLWKPQREPSNNITGNLGFDVTGPGLMVNPSRPDPGQREKINSNILIRPFEATLRTAKMKI